MKNLSTLVGHLILIAGVAGCAIRNIESPVYSEISSLPKQEEKQNRSMTLSWTFSPNEERVWAYSVYIGKKGQNTNVIPSPLNITTAISGLEPGVQYGVGVKTYNSMGEEVSLPFSKK